MAEGVFRVSFDPKAIKEIERAFEKNYEASAAAASESIRVVSRAILLKGRLNIAHSGNFTGKWIRGLQARQYPRKKASTHAAVYINHRFGGLASVFEFGATIRPKRGRYLWIPTTKTKTLGNAEANFATGIIESGRIKKTIGSAAQRAGGRLDFMKSKKTGLPMLGVMTGKGNRKRFQPMFVGLPRVIIHKRWSIIPIAESEAQRVPELFMQALRKIDNG